MNIYEYHEALLEHRKIEKKYALFFFFRMAFGVILGSLIFICFINLAMRSKTREFVRQIAQLRVHLMNLMNTYEVRVYKRFFEKVCFMTSDLMNLKRCTTSCKFIKLMEYGYE